MTNPDYRQDPWKESIKQALEFCDQVVVIYGFHGQDIDDDSDLDRVWELQKDYPGKLQGYYLRWPQPEWSYDELPRHLNEGLRIARELDADWAFKFDIDTLIHENDFDKIRNALQEAKKQKVKLCKLEKKQFFMVDRYYEKGKIPLFVNTDFPIWYGYDRSRYTDLCQPITWNGESRVIARDQKFLDSDNGIPAGKKISDMHIKAIGGHCWNYDYSFKTLERAKELLYYFDIAHAKWWGRGYSGLKIDEITPETALNDYLGLVAGRIKKCQYKIKPEDHPKHMIETVKNIKPERFGHNLWGLI